MSFPTPGALEQHIAQLEAQLAKLKKDQNLLQDLQARKEELTKELQRVNGQIASITGKAPSLPQTTPAVPPKAASAAKPPAPATKANSTPAKVSSKPATPARATAKATAKTAAPPLLLDLIVACLKRAKGKPVTVKQLTNEALQQGLTTTSSSPYKIVESRVQDLRMKGVVVRAKDQPGWVLNNDSGAAAVAKPTTASKVGAAAARSSKPNA